MDPGKPGRGPGLVPRHPLLHEMRQGGFPLRYVAASRPPPASPRTRTLAIWISMRTTNSMKLVAGWMRQASELPGWVP